MAVLSRVYRRWFLLILTGALALRLAWAIAVPIAPLSDSIVYDQLAWNLASRCAYEWNNGDITAYWPVGTSFVYSLVFRLFGHHLAPAAALNILVGTASVALVMILARRWTSNAAAIAAGALYALWPSQIEFTSILASELLFNFLLLLALWVSVARIRSWTVKGLLAGGLLAGAAYVRPTALPLVVLLAAGIAWRRPADWKTLGQFAIAALLAMAICIAPWTWRNMRELGAPVPISTNGAANFWMGNNPNANGAYIPLPEDVSRLSEVDRSKVLGNRAWQFILGHPGQAALLFGRKLVITHERETIGISWNETSLRPAIGETGMKAAKAASTVYWWLALLLGLGGTALLLRKAGWRGILHPALLAWGYFAFVHAGTVGADRYHFPSVPFIAMLAGGALAHFAARLQHPCAVVVD